ncbi:MAG: dihydroorotase [Candidatus Omnitrophica bacterium]|nr:dihydroorotase [Candidatus Omnitrophota bacterium]MCM8824599.1 dihydroorotase [Candidatus Omnitrophota bacterium]
MEILIKNIRVIDPYYRIDNIRDVLISGASFSQISKSIHKKNPKTIDGTGLWLIPGLIDMHCHLREPGNEGEETILSGSISAAAGGFTTICCMANTDPPIDNKVVAGYIFEKAKNAPIKVLPYGTITAGRKGTSLSPMGELSEAGVIGFSDDGNCVMDSLIFRRALEYSKPWGKIVVSHSEDQILAKNGVMNEGILSTKLGLRGIPAEAEHIMVYRDISLAKLTGAKLHLAHLTTKKSLDLVREAKKKFKNITCEVAVHHLVLTEDALSNYDANAKVNPPLRTQQDIRALVKGIKENIIDAIVTDHAPHSEEEKGSGIENAPFGMIGFETALPLAMSLVKYGLKPIQIIEKLTIGPARVLKIQPGTITQGAEANCVIFDPEKEWVVTKDNILSQSKNTPFLNKKIKGKVLYTFHRGSIVYSDKSMS